ncbi:MAG: 3-isopropylmalate dehydratase small subunit [Acidobacteria bacterium]|nr:MAG: 3-isopropylmalate dehydratase small subunit [Acidobacteriota bacterium]REK09356.1 MAG: 3-isopropylmalate dehydratase small subunit [Acidobacteriota bacterium]
MDSVVAPLPIDNIDTDQIIPARYLKVTDKSGLAEGLFANWRWQDPQACAGPRADWVLHQEPFRGAEILVTGENFGCGSSREHAPWALLGGGIRAVVSTRFADIFRANALKNGLLTVTVEPRVADRLMRESLEAQSGGREPVRARIDLGQQQLDLPWEVVSFDIDPFAKHCILTGVDQMGYLVDQEGDIARFEEGHEHFVDTRELVARG